MGKARLWKVLIKLGKLLVTTGEFLGAFGKDNKRERGSPQGIIKQAFKEKGKN